MDYSSSNNEREWKDITIDEARYIISTLTMKNSWKISMSNLVEIWTETITEDIALARCQSLNVLLDLDSFDIKETLDVVLNDIPKYATHKSVNEIKLQTCIDGNWLKFCINFMKGGPPQFFNEITRPLCSSSMELQRRHEIILDLIKRKDEELSEYKLSGAELIRKNIATVPYNKDVFSNEVSVRSRKSSDCLNTFQSMMDLYNEFHKGESLINSSHRSLSEDYSDPNPVRSDVKIKNENAEAFEMTEMQSEIDTEATVAKPTIGENESITAGSELMEQYQGGQISPSASESNTGLRTKEKPKKRTTINDMANVALISTEQRSKESKKPKMTRNIYDFIA